MSEQDVFAMDNPDFDWPDGQPPATEQATTEQAPPAAEPSAPEQPAPDLPQPAAPAAAPDPDRFGDVARAIRESERARADAEVARAIAERDRQWQQAYAQPQAQQEPPDPVLEPDAYRDWVKQSVMADVAPQVEAVKAQAAEMLYQQSLASAKALDPNWDKYLAAANALCQEDPGLVGIIQGSNNPGLAIIRYGKMALAANGEAPQPAPQQLPAPSGIPDAIRQQVLAEEAARRAAAGQPPQLNLPRGVGSAPSGAGMSDTAPPPTEWGRLAASNPGEWSRVKSQVLGGPGGVL